MFSNHHRTSLLMNGVNKENSVQPIKALEGTKSTANTKTPARSSKPRRAFGDISNQKKNVGPTRTKSVSKPPQRSMRTAISSSSVLSLKRSEGVILPRSSTMVPLPIFEDKKELANKFELSGMKASVPTTVGPSDNVEASAGRLWSEQIDQDDNSIVSLDGVATLHEDWATARQKRQQLKLQLEEEERQRLEIVFDNYVNDAPDDQYTSPKSNRSETFSIFTDFDSTDLDEPSLAFDISF